MAFAIIVAKQLFGGLGHNIFNPAMVGYVVVLISFPQEMTQWLLPRELAGWTPGFMASLESILTGTLAIPAALAGADGITGATPLDTIKTGLAQAQSVTEIRSQTIFGDFGGLGWEWIANWYLVGGLYLLYRRVISWHVPVATLGAVIALGLAGWLLDPAVNPQPMQQIFSGGLMLAAFFIATDPVSGCASPRGRLIFGAGVGILTLVIRRWGGYPDGIAFAVLLMNSAAPLIDRYTRPRVYGR
jgi:electron transport complex protein RnfD